MIRRLGDIGPPRSAAVSDLRGIEPPDEDGRSFVRELSPVSLPMALTTRAEPSPDSSSDESRLALQEGLALWGTQS